MTSPLRVTAGDLSSLRLTIDVEQVRRVLVGMPKVAYFWTRDFMFRAFVKHRITWLASKGTQFGRGDDKSRGIKVSRINEGQGQLGDNEVRYSVEPKEKRMPTADAADRGLKELRAVVETGNTILPVHEFGTDIRSARPMFVPVKTRPGNFQKWRQQNPQKSLLFLPSKRGSDKQLVYEVVLKRRRGRVKADFVGPAPVDVKLRLRWVLTRFVAMKPTLKLFDSWTALEGERNTLLAQTATKMLRDLERKDPRDF